SSRFCVMFVYAKVPLDEHVTPGPALMTTPLYSAMSTRLAPATVACGWAIADPSQTAAPVDPAVQAMEVHRGDTDHDVATLNVTFPPPGNRAMRTIRSP